MTAAVCPQCGRLIRAHAPGAHPVVGLIDHAERCRPRSSR